MSDARSLISAIERGAHSDVAALLKSGLDPNQQVADDDRSPLIYAAVSGNAKVVRELVVHGADPTFKDGVGWTAAMYASLEGFDQVVKELSKLDRVPTGAL